MNAKALLDLLAEKHAADVFVPECKTGPTQSASSCPRLDAWCMNRSWSNAKVIGYEIKISRSDFLRDNKWSNYLDFCNEFYFVAPKGLLAIGEIPHDAGLIESSTNAKRLIIKKKAPFRNVQIPESLFRYILMGRAHIVKEHYFTKDASYWAEWLERRKEEKQIGREVAELVGEAPRKIEEENRTLRQRQEHIEREYADVRRVLQELGIADSWYLGPAVRRKIQRLQELENSPFIANVRCVIDEIDKFKDLLPSHD